MVPRSWPAPALFALTMLLPRGVTAAPIDKQACVDAATRGQIQRDDQKLRAAVEAFEQCAATSCPAAVQKSCTEWLHVVQASVPTVTVVSPSGSTTKIDDVEGTTATLDPGVHTVHVEAPGKAPFDQKLDLRPNDRKTIQVELTDLVRPTKQVRPAPVLSLVLGGVAVAGIASFAVFGTLARSDTNALQDRCAPACTTSERDAAFDKAIVADISLGVGILAAAIGGYFYFTRPTRTVYAISPGSIRGTF